MKRSTLAAAAVAAGAVLTLAGCATSGTPGARTAEVMCQGLATADGLSTADLGAAVAADGGFRVPMKVQDRVGRRIDTSCVYANNEARWAQPLPAGLSRR